MNRTSLLQHLQKRDREMNTDDERMTISCHFIFATRFGGVLFVVIIARVFIGFIWNMYRGLVAIL